MTDFVIACLSQKGGVGKSTLARLVARTYASAGWSVKICDLNGTQLTSTTWAGLRMTNGITPQIDAQPISNVKRVRGEDYDLVVIDGKPDSDISSLEAARTADLVLLPTGLTVDDLKPTMSFAAELMAKRVEAKRILFVFSRTGDSELALREASTLLKRNGFEHAETNLREMTSYGFAMNRGYAVSETPVASLAERADQLAAEIVNKMTSLTTENAA